MVMEPDTLVELRLYASCQMGRLKGSVHLNEVKYAVHSWEKAGLEN